MGLVLFVIICSVVFGIVLSVALGIYRNFRLERTISKAPLYGPHPNDWPTTEGVLLLSTNAQYDGLEQAAPAIIAEYELESLPVAHCVSTNALPHHLKEIKPVLIITAGQLRQYDDVYGMTVGNPKMFRRLAAKYGAPLRYVPVTCDLYPDESQSYAKELTKK